MNNISVNTSGDEEEEWRPVVGYEGYYEVSDLGRVKSLTRTIEFKGGREVTLKGKMIKPGKHSTGYLVVGLNKNHIQEMKRVHRVVAEAFIPNPENKPQVNHLNGIKTDNSLINLEWNTVKENIRHAFDTGLNKRGEMHYGTQLMKWEVLEVCDLLDFTKMTLAEIAVKFNTSRNTITSVNLGNSWNWLTSRKGNIKVKTVSERRSKPVKNCRGEVFKSAKEASKYYKVSHTELCQASNGKREFCGNYLDGTKIKWEYLND